MKIPFDIKYRPQIESGEYKVVTRDGSPVRIICWDRKSAGDGQPIVALVEKGHYENSIWVEENGVYKGTMGHEYDLFIIIPEPELTEFEEEIKDLINDARHLTDIQCDGSQKFVSEDDLRKTYAKTLLELAKKELLGQWNENMKDEYARGKRDGLTIGYNKAMKEYNESVAYHYPTYQPPCFHGGVCTNPFKDCINCPRQSSDYTNTTTSGTCKKD